MEDFDLQDILNSGKGEGSGDPSDYDRSFRIDRPSGDVIDMGMFGSIKFVDPRPSQMGVGEAIELSVRIKQDWSDLEVTQYECGTGSGLLYTTFHALSSIGF